MPRGQPDFGMYAVKEVAASISDMGEVAARLGSIVIYDKRGDVVDFDNFEEPLLRWRSNNGVGGAVVIHDSASARSSSQSVKLVTPAGAGSSAYIVKKVSILGTKRLGVEISFANVDTFLEFHISGYFYSGTTLSVAELLLDFNSRKLYIFDETGAQKEVATFTKFFQGLFIYYTIKLVADYGTGEYVRLLLGNLEYDISATKLETVDSDIAPFFETTIGVWNRTAAGATMYIDDHIITQAEP